MSIGNELGLPKWLIGKRLLLPMRGMQEMPVQSQLGKIPWRRKWQPTPEFLPRRFHGQRSLASYTQSPKESDMIEQLIMHTMSYTVDLWKLFILYN